MFGVVKVFVYVVYYIEEIYYFKLVYCIFERVGVVFVFSF